MQLFHHIEIVTLPSFGWGALFMKTSVIYAQSPSSWAYRCFDENAQQLESGVISAWSELPDDIDAIELLIPGVCIVSSQVTIPVNLSRKQFQATLAFSLEDQFSEEPDQLQHAIQFSGTGDLAYIDTIAASTLSEYLQDAPESLSRVTADYYAVPMRTNAWHIYSDDLYARVRISEYSGFSVAKSLLLTTLQLKLKEAELPPERIVIRLLSDKLMFTADDFADCSVPVEIEHQPAEFLDAIEPSAINAGINLLQGQFQRKQSSQKAAWLSLGVASSLALTLLVFVLGNAAQYAYLRYENMTQAEQIKQLYLQAYPDAKQIVSPKWRVERELQKYQSGEAKAEVFTLLSRLYAQMQKQKLVLSQLTFKDKRLRIDLAFNSFDELETFKTALTQAGLKVKQDEANKTGAKIIAKLQVEE